MKRVARAIVVAALLASAAAVNAAAPQHEPVKFEPQRFDAQRDALESELAKGETYRSIEPTNRAKVMAALDRIERSLGDATSFEQLDEARRKAVIGDQETINVLLTQAAADSRVLCMRETPIGTRMPVRVCKTVGERRREQRHTQDQYRSASGASGADESMAPAGGS